MTLLPAPLPHQRPPAITQGTLLAGRVRYAQARDGFRTGIEPVLLAAAVPASPGQRVLEGGAGAGAGLLCLAARVPDLGGLGVEREPALCALARANAAANGFSRLEFRMGDVGRLSEPGGFDHAFANPPWHSPEGTRSPAAARAGAKHASLGLLDIWVGALGRCLRRGGTLSLILPAAAVPACLRAAEAAGCGGTALLPLWPRRDRPAKIVLVRTEHASRAPFRVCPGLVLHSPSGDFTDEANAVLRGGAALAF